MKKCLVRIFSILVLGALWVVHLGCASSTPTRFYSLSAPDPTGPEMKSSTGDRCVSLGIGPIGIPDYLDQPRIVSRGSSNQLTLAEFDRWAARLSIELARVIARNLSTQLCTETIVFFPWRGGIPINYRIEMEIIRMDGSLGGNATLEAWWMVLSGDAKEMVLNKRSTFTEAVSGSGYDSLVSAHSRTVSLLSREIAETIKTISNK